MNSNQNYFSQLSDYYDLIYADKNYEKETAYVIRELRKLDPTIKFILELGSGTGNYSSYLCKAGYHVTGVEKSLYMINRSKFKTIQGFTPVHQDILFYESNEKFDAVVSLFHVISYFNLTQDLIKCFDMVCTHLKVGGYFLFDVWYSPAVHHLHPQTKIKKIENSISLIYRITEPTMKYQENVVDVAYEFFILNKDNQEITKQITRFQETHSMRHFSTPEIKFMAELCGLQLISCEEFLTAKNADHTTWGVCYVLKKSNI